MIYLSDVGFIGGERRPIDEVICREASPRLLPLLKNDGFRWFGKSDSSVAQLAAKAVSASLERAKIQASEIDALIVCTESFWDIYRERQNGFEPRDTFISEMCHMAGLENAMPYGIWLRGCTNFASALSVARALVFSQQHRKVMVVLADRVRAGANRLAMRGPTIFSDGAAAVIVSELRGGYLVRSIELHFSEKLARTRDRRNLLLYGKTLVEELHIFRKRRAARGAHQLKDHDILLTDNFHSMFLDFLSEPFSVDRRKLSSPTKPEGHCFSADGLRSLLHIEEAGKHSTGTSLALLSLGPTGAAIVSIEAV